jgi:NACHT conflict system protein/NACHT domain-containing protein/Leucine Rich Repeat (LRR) protein
MALIEVLTLQLGSAVAKSILKLWLKDSSIAQDLGSELLDIVKSRTSDQIAQRRAQRQFEQIGEKVAESLLPLFESEASALDEGSQTAVALAVAQTLNQTGIDPALLAEHDLEPSKLAKYLLDADPNLLRQFTQSELALYQRIISESSELIVDIASQLPAFTERTFAEVLKRENILLARTEQILEEVRRIRASSQQNNPEAEAARFEAEYRRAVVRKLDELELFGVDVSAASRRHRLSVAYVTLSVVQPALAGTENTNKISRDVDPEAEDVDDEENRYIVAVDAALARANRLIVRGQAGSGKTTLLQWVAVRSAAQTFEEPLARWNDTTPFFIRLRQCAQDGLPAPEDFPRLVAPAIAGTMPARWVHDKLRSGQAIVLIDGVDEVAQSLREQVRQWLKELAGTYPNARLIVSSRPHAIDEGWLEHEGFDEAELQPMEPHDIGAFIDHWHAAVREELRDEEEKAALVSQAERMKKTVQRTRAIRNLATSPLLCAMLCALNRARRQQLPADRIELYRASCEMLLDRRDKERDVDLRDYPAIGYRQKLVLLQDLAYWLIVNGWSMVALERAQERIERRLPNLQGIPQGTTSADVLRLFVERSGMVRSPVVGQIDFTHRTFQEYLAAQEALDEGDTGVLVQHAHDDQWREVIVLAAGLANKRRREEIIQGLMERGDNEPDRRYQLHLLAVACLETSVELGPNVKAEVQDRLINIVPPQNMTDAKALAAAGELALPYLRKKGQRRASVDTACIRALALIGGEAALDTLESYSKDTRQAVSTELLRAIEFFEREEYTRRVLATLAPTPFRIDSVSLFEKVKYLSGLTSLDLNIIISLSDLSPLADLTNLTSLNLNDCSELTDLSPLADLTNLTSLYLWSCRQLTNLSPLVDLTNLTLLYLWSCRQLTDLSQLAGLTNLTRLNLCNCSQLTDISPLSGLVNLTSLDLSGCGSLSGLSGLTGLSSLTSLSLLGCSRVSDLSPLKDLSKLQNLYVDGISPDAEIPDEIRTRFRLCSS